MSEYLKVNYDAMERLTAIAQFHGTQVVLFGGDLSNGYTQYEADFQAQLRAWKQAVSGLTNSIPIYALPGNHEALLKSFNDTESKYGVGFDRWPYDKHSTEAIFAQEMVNPTDGPKARDGFPSYDETAYTFQYGCVKFIGFNTNYWMESDSSKSSKSALQNQLTQKYGGCPEGYVMSEQLQWLEPQIAAADKDESVKYIILFAHEPIFPNGKHLQDAMWYNGNNNSRACVFANGKINPEKLGVIEVRNRIARVVSQSAKTVCVINSDEHAYYRTKIDKNTPVGDDRDIVDNQIDWKNGKISPLSGLKHPKWYIVCGGGGAPFSAEKTSPWNRYWKSQGRGQRGYRYTPQEHILLFSTSDRGVSLRVVNSLGETIDGERNLLSIQEAAK